MKPKQIEQRKKEEIYRAYEYLLKTDDRSWLDSLPKYLGLTMKQINSIVYQLPIFKENYKGRKKKTSTIFDEPKDVQFNLYYKFKRNYLKTNKYNIPTNLMQALESFSKEVGYPKKELEKWFASKEEIYSFA